MAPRLSTRPRGVYVDGDYRDTPYLDRREADHGAPFRDRIGETDEDVRQRAAGLDPDELRAWFDRFSSYTHPDSYGQSGCDRLYSYCWDEWRKPEVVAAERRRLARWAAGTVTMHREWRPAELPGQRRRRRVTYQYMRGDGTAGRWATITGHALGYVICCWSGGHVIRSTFIERLREVCEQAREWVGVPYRP